MLLRSLNKISWPLIYLRVNTSNPRLQQPSTTRWDNLVLKISFKNLIQILQKSVSYVDFAKICISPKPSGAPVGKVPLQALKELEHQARQNLSTINFTATFSRAASSCNTVFEKCQHSIKATFKRVKSQFKRVPISKELSDVVMITPVIILKS